MLRHIRLLRQRHSPKLSEEDRAVLDQIEEQMSGSDWTKFGTFFGVLWYKLDRIISNLDDIRRNTK
jgi:hypothetical protein